MYRSLPLYMTVVIIFFQTWARPMCAETSGATTVAPHPGVGSFQIDHNTDHPILAYYGGIGLRLDENGHWTDYGISNKRQVDYLINRLAENGMDRICANIMFQWTPSKLMGPIPIHPESEDAESLYGYAIEQAHKHNIEFYIDIPVFGRRTRDEAFASANSEIFAVSSTGEVREEFFSPAHPKVRAHRIAILMEALAQYPADGILLDFIRWPNYGLDLMGDHCDWGYEPVMLKRFRDAYGLPEDFVPEPDDTRFIQARAECVNQFIRELRDVMDDKGIDIPIGVYNSNIYGREGGLRHVCQDWAAWEQQSLVEQHHPMFYMDSPARLTRALHTLIEVKRPESSVLGPIFLDGPGPFTDKTLTDAAERMIKVGADGIWFCREMEIEQLGLWPAVKQISEMSIAEIRSRDFDPYAHNLCVNGGFDDQLEYWTTPSEQRSRFSVHQNAEGDSRLRIAAAASGETWLSQRIEHYPSPVVALRSMGLSVRYDAGRLITEQPATLVCDLNYSDGHTYRHTISLPDDEQVPSALQGQVITFEVDYRPDRFLESTVLTLRVPEGAEHLVVAEVNVTEDPLHNPMNHKVEELAQ